MEELFKILHKIDIFRQENKNHQIMLLEYVF